MICIWFCVSQEENHLMRPSLHKEKIQSKGSFNPFQWMSIYSVITFIFFILVRIQLLRVLENQKMVLQKEQGMAYARVAVASFDTQYMADLVSFAELFRDFRLRYYCLNTCHGYSFSTSLHSMSE